MVFLCFPLFSLGFPYVFRAVRLPGCNHIYIYGSTPSHDPDFSVFKDKKLKINDSSVEIIS